MPLAEVVRSGFVEGRHHGSVVVLDADGAVVAGAGDPYGPIFPRSSNKPMQAVAMLRAGLVLDDDADLALVAASHSGEPFHVDRVRTLLARAGVGEDALHCPPGPAAVGAGARRGAARRWRPRPGLHELLGQARRHAAHLPHGRLVMDDYLMPEHPLQRACRDAVAELTGEAVAAVGVDGCGAPLFAVSLAGLGRAFLAAVQAPPDSAARRVADAMRGYPEVMSGTGREDARLMRAVPGLFTRAAPKGWAWRQCRGSALSQ